MPIPRPSRPYPPRPATRLPSASAPRPPRPTRTANVPRPPSAAWPPGLPPRPRTRPPGVTIRPRRPHGVLPWWSPTVIYEPALVPAPAPDNTEYARWIQSTLNRVMGLQLPVNGEMTPETRSAIRSFQARQGLPADGIVGPQTEAALIAASGQSPAPAESTPPSGELEPYEYPSIERVSPEWVNPGPDYVRWAQNALNTVLGLRLAIDGRVGTQTRSAVRRFQQARGLPVSGRIGPETERALIAAGADRPPLDYKQRGTARPAHLFQ